MESSLGERVLVEDIAHLLGARVGNFNTDVCRVGGEGCCESVLFALRESIRRGAQEKPDLVEGIARVSAVAQSFLLDAAVHLTCGVHSELDDMKIVQHAGCVLELIINGVLAVPGMHPVSRFAPPRPKVFSARGQPVLVHDVRPAWNQVQQPGRRMILPACQVHDVGQFPRVPGGVGPGGSTGVPLLEFLLAYGGTSPAPDAFVLSLGLRACTLPCRYSLRQFFSGVALA